MEFDTKYFLFDMKSVALWIHTDVVEWNKFCEEKWRHREMKLYIICFVMTANAAMTKWYESVLHDNIKMSPAIFHQIAITL